MNFSDDLNAFLPSSPPEVDHAPGKYVCPQSSEQSQHHFVFNYDKGKDSFTCQEHEHKRNNGRPCDGQPNIVLFDREIPKVEIQNKPTASPEKHDKDGDDDETRYQVGKNHKV